MTVSGGLQPGESLEESYSDNDGVSIPMTVSGGLQRASRSRRLSAPASFNTDDGIGRATTPEDSIFIPVNGAFQYR